ncbi:MAG: hypothetical protein ACH350_01460 [Parachlamydiaceae bacterium]
MFIQFSSPSALFASPILDVTRQGRIKGLVNFIGLMILSVIGMYYLSTQFSLLRLKIKAGGGSRQLDNQLFKSKSNGSAPLPLPHLDSLPPKCGQSGPVNIGKIQRTGSSSCELEGYLPEDDQRKEGSKNHNSITVDDYLNGFNIE